MASKTGANKHWNVENANIYSSFEDSNGKNKSRHNTKRSETIFGSRINISTSTNMSTGRRRDSRVIKEPKAYKCT